MASAAWRPLKALPHPVEGLPHPVEGLSHPVEGWPHRVEGWPHRVEGWSHPVEGWPRPVEGLRLRVERWPLPMGAGAGWTKARAGAQGIGPGARCSRSADFRAAAAWAEHEEARPEEIRAVAQPISDGFRWFWIGWHVEYDGILRGR
jgi:hypothetical protein